MSERVALCYMLRVSFHGVHLENVIAAFIAYKG